MTQMSHASLKSAPSAVVPRVRISPSPGRRFGGELVGGIQLASGRFAMIRNGMGFSHVAWDDALERRIGQQIEGMGLPGGAVDWAFGRKHGLEL